MTYYYKPMIVQCPSCSTKFAIDENQFKAIENPRFHCSRCDHFFDYGQATKKEKEAEAALTDTTSPAEITTRAEIAPAEVSTSEFVPSAFALPRAAKQLELLPSSQSVKLSLTPPRLDLAPKHLDIESISGLSIQWPDSLTDQPIAVDIRKTLDPDAGFSFPRLRTESALRPRPEEGSFNPIDWPGETFSSRELFPLNPAGEPERVLGESYQALPTESIGEDLPEPDLSNSIQEREFIIGEPSDLRMEDAEEAIETKPAETVTPEFSPPPVLAATAGISASSESVLRFPTKTVREEYTEPYRIPLAEPIQESLIRAAMEEAPPSITRRFMPAIIASSFPLILCAWFGWWSNHLSEAPGFLASWATTVPDTLARVAPSGMEIIDLRSQVITLDDGKQVLQIFGNVFNATTGSYKNVRIEAASYDKQNQPVARTIINPNNALSSVTHVNSLKLDALEKLQSSQNSPVQELKPGEHVPFRIVLTSPIDQVSWFSARLYSVEMLS